MRLVFIFRSGTGRLERHWGTGAGVGGLAAGVLRLPQEEEQQRVSSRVTNRTGAKSAKDNNTSALTTER